MLVGTLGSDLVEHEAYAFLLRRFQPVNLLPRCPERWPPSEARTRATILPLAPVVLLLGRRVAAAFGLDWLDFFEWTEHRRYPIDRERRYVVLPHPSGLNRMYNRTEVRARVGDTLREALRYAEEMT